MIVTPEEQIQNLRDLLHSTLQVLHPPKLQPLSEWSEDNFIIMDGGEPGKYRLSTAPYQKEILDTFTDDRYNRVVIMAASQMVKTVSLMAYTMYCIDRDPSPIMIVQPTKQSADDFASARLEPTLINNPAVRHHFLNMSNRHSGHTKRLKIYPGGYISVANAGSVSELASKPIRILLADEIDRYADSKEGDALSLAEKRTSTYWNRKIVLVSTPTDEFSKIAKEYQNSDRRIYEVPCMDCGSMQQLRWQQVKWSNDKGLETWQRADTAYYECEHCHAQWDEAARDKSIRNGVWKATNPEHPTAGFFINAIASPFLKLSQLVLEHYAALEDPQKRISFTNTRLAETVKDASTSINPQQFLNRIEAYTPDNIPNQIGLITCGADVQIDRIECEVVGWGAGDESWCLGYYVLSGSTESDVPYDQLLEVLKKQHTREDGVKMKIQATCIDAGGEDSATQQTFLFAHKNRRLNIYPIKGRSGNQLLFDARSKDWKKKQYGRFYNVGVDTAKTRHFSFMNVEEEGPGFMHFCEGLSQEYFEGLASEARVQTKSRGKTKIKWVIKSGIRNEPLDARIYAMAARGSFHNVDIGSRAESISNKQGEKQESKKEEKKEVEQKKQETPKQTSARKHQEYIQRIQALRNQRPQGWISGRGKSGFG